LTLNFDHGFTQLSYKQRHVESDYRPNRRFRKLDQQGSSGPASNLNSSSSSPTEIYPLMMRGLPFGTTIDSLDTKFAKWKLGAKICL